MTDAVDDHDRITYTSRQLQCTRCGVDKENHWMQLSTTTRYRDIHCTSCGLHERCSHHHCQCGVIWHQCATHRIDPTVHRTRSNAPAKKQKDATGTKQLPSTRKAPTIACSRGGRPTRRRIGGEAINQMRFRSCLSGADTIFLHANRRQKSQV